MHPCCSTSHRSPQDRAATIRVCSAAMIRFGKLCTILCTCPTSSSVVTFPCSTNTSTICCVCVTGLVGANQWGDMPDAVQADDSPSQDAYQGSLKAPQGSKFHEPPRSVNVSQQKMSYLVCAALDPSQDAWSSALANGQLCMDSSALDRSAWDWPAWAAGSLLHDSATGVTFCRADAVRALPPLLQQQYYLQQQSFRAPQPPPQPSLAPPSLPLQNYLQQQPQQLPLQAELLQAEAAPQVDAAGQAQHHQAPLPAATSLLWCILQCLCLSRGLSESLHDWAASGACAFFLLLLYPTTVFGC